ncbi:MAG: STAS domain-containing protein [Planctomycetes bacterium]|nr:STAS domain-containing protein [Planctomycetota bacterium]
MDDITVVRFHAPRLQSEEQSRTLFDQIISLVRNLGRRKLVLNLQGVQFAASAALGQMVFLNKVLQSQNGRLALCCLSETVLQALETTALVQVFQIYDEEQQALESFTMMDREDRDDATILRIKAPELRPQDVPFLFEEMANLVAHEGRRRIVLCFSNVEALGEGREVDLKELARNKVLTQGGRLALCHLAPAVHEALGRPILDIFPDEEEALRSL